MDWRQYAMSFWNDYQLMINMQLAMCQMLANNQQQQQQQHSQQQKRTLKRLTNKRERKVTTNDQRRLTTETEELLSPMICHDYHDLEYRPVTSEIMENYLAKRSHRTLTIYHAKVAQKSYGNEKRFFCPPPCIYLSGADWTTTDSTASSFHYQDSLSAKISIHDSNWQNLSIDDYGPMKYGSARTLFISDSDKRKYIHLNIQLLSEDSTPIGMFASRKIKIISKPSKKKQSLKNNELCIQSGTNVTLFNRLRSQNVSTRFLHVDEDEQFYASAQQWGSFSIHLLDNNNEDDGDDDDDRLSNEEKCIQYGATVKFVCSRTDRSLPDLIIRKVDKNRVLLDCEEPVSQLHKCAFELKNNSSQEHIYLAIENERIIKTSGVLCPNEPFQIDINDSACWTIISTDKIEYNWYESQGPVSHPITPIPIANQLTINNEDTRSMVEITGENFSPGLSVWFGEIESPSTEYQSTQTIIAEIPHSISNKSISFVRRDGIIYPTSLTVTFCE